MKKLIGKVSILISMVVFGHSVSAQVYACQFIQSAGLSYKNNEWRTATFQLESPFFLKIDNARISQETAAKILRNLTPVEVSCTSRYSFLLKSTIFTCSDYSAQLIFSPDSLLGAVSQIFGSIASTPERDSLAVSRFNCQKI